MAADSTSQISEHSFGKSDHQTKARRRKLKFGSLADAAEEVTRLAQADYERAGTWSLQQVLQHLNKTMEIAFEGHPFLLPAMVRPVAKLVGLPLMRMGVQFPAGAKAPIGLIPVDDPDLETEVAKFLKLAKLIGDPSTVLHSLHPLLGKINHEQWNAMQRWHAAHHLSFIVPR